MHNEDYYRLLGISETATEIEIRKAYIKMIRKYPNETSPEEFKMLTKAYKTLSDKELRDVYDEQLTQSRSEVRSAHIHQPLHSVEPEVIQPNEQQDQSEELVKVKNLPKKKKIILPILLACAVIYILVFALSPSEENVEPIGDIGVERDSNVGNEPPKAAPASTNNEEENESQVQENPLVSAEEIETFLQEYTLASVEVLNGKDFSLVEPFLDPRGAKLKEQRSYTQYLLSKGITEEVLSLSIKQIDRNGSLISVSTEEDYNLFYPDGTVKRKLFESKYNIKEEAGKLLVNELLFTTELKSEEVKGPELSVETNSVDEFVNEYLIESVNAINAGDLTYVEPYLAPDSKRYHEQLKYIEYLKEKGITEELVSYELVSVEDKDDDVSEVTTRESYTIYYSNGSSLFKEFESRYLIVRKHGEYLVSQLLYTQEVE